MLHGAAACERDPFDRLVPLLPEDLLVASLRGPVPEGVGYSWVSPADRANARTDREVAAIGHRAAGSILAWLNTFPDFETLGLLGASQGACVAFQLIRAVPSRFVYVINLSGYCLPGSEAGDLELQRTKPAVFWGRGSFDDVIPVDYISRTATWLSQHSTLTERTYEMGHEISTAELADAAAFVLEQIG
jgi:phospholipase/carboxylesterase